MDKIISAVKQDCKFQVGYNVTFEQTDGKQYTAYFMPEPVYKYEVLKRKLAEQYNLPAEAIEELVNVVEDLQHYYNQGAVESDPDY